MKKLLVLVFCLAVVLNGSAQWISHTISHDSGGHPTTLGDCDNDGDADIITFNELTKRIEILENLDQGRFAADDHLITTFTDLDVNAMLEPVIKFADLDNDGLGDLVVYYFSTTYNTMIAGWMKNLDNFDFDSFLQVHAYPPTTSFTGKRSSPIGDFDADGDMDITILEVTASDCQVKLLENDGVGNFTQLNLGVVAGPPGSFYPTIHAGDKDNDGDTDLIYDQLWFENDGAGWVAHNFSYFDTGMEVFSAFYYDGYMADFNNDGYNDIVNPSVYTTEEVFYLTLGDASSLYTWGNTTMLPAPAVGMQISRYDYVDMDGDSDVDIVAFHDTYGELGFGWYENYGDGTFSPFNELFFKMYDNSLSVVDFCYEDLTGDGLPDFFIASTHEVKDAYMTNLGGNQFGRFNSVRNTDQPVRVLAADFTGDGKDEVVTTGWENLTMSVYNQYDQGIFGYHHVFFPIENGTHYSFIPDTLDFDNDADLDLLIAFKGSESDLAFYKNNGGMLEDYVLVGDSLDHINEMEVVDFNTDGFNDILLVTAPLSGSGDSSNAVIIFQNDGVGGFVRDTLLQTFDFYDDYKDISPCDFNQDGLIDFALAGAYSDSLHWYENDGTGGFIEHLVYPTVPMITDAGTNRVEYADFNGDGFWDILCSFSEGTVYVYLNDGTGNFTTETFVSLINPYTLIDHTDIDNDGDEDLLFTHDLVGLVWYLNDGSANFTSVELVSSNISGSFCVSDINSDGQKDIVGLHTIGGPEKTVVWYEGGTSMLAVPDETTELNTQYVYPNPASEEITLTLTEALEGESNSVVIYSLQGQKMQEQAVAENASVIQVNVDQLVEGYYIVVVRNTTGTIVSSPFVIQR